MPGMGPGGMPDPSRMNPKQRAMFEKIQQASPEERKRLMQQMEQMMSNFGGGVGGNMGGPPPMGEPEDDSMETVNLDGPQVLSAGPTSDYDML